VPKSSKSSPAVDLHTRLQARRPEIKRDCLERVHAISDPGVVADPSYREGLRLAVSAALDYGLVVVHRPSEALAAPVPLALLAQARTAAHAGVSLETVLRRYSAGSALLRDCLIEEAEGAGLDNPALKRLLGDQATLFDRLLKDVGVEYRQALEVDLDPAQRHARRIERLVAGESTDTTGIPYDFNAHHVGVVVSGPVLAEAIRNLAQALDRRALIVPTEKDTLWVWLGGRRALDTRDFHRLASAREWPPGVSVASGEPGFGLPGWRFSHRQAQAALAIAKLDPEPVKRYADVAVQSTLVRDDLLVSSLHQMYLSPLEQERDGGKVLRDTLRAYFASEEHASSAAAALGVKRHTVTNRLRKVEARLGQSLATCATALNAALSIEELSSGSVQADQPLD
jgi:PucR C-terminal helix-turn-helix domain/GGDEF-like domain